MLKHIIGSINTYLGLTNIIIGTIQIAMLTNSIWFKISGTFLILSGFIQLIVLFKKLKKYS